MKNKHEPIGYEILCLGESNFFYIEGLKVYQTMPLNDYRTELYELDKSNTQEVFEKEKYNISKKIKESGLLPPLSKNEFRERANEEINKIPSSEEDFENYIKANDLINSKEYVKSEMKQSYNFWKNSLKMQRKKYSCCCIN